MDYSSKAEASVELHILPTQQIIMGVNGVKE
jgi:hypothetical protein